MTLDWFTVVVEIINFLILVWLLQRFLYKPIVNTMNAREQTIENRLQSAAEKEEAAQAAAARYHAKQEELQAQRDAYLEQARADADARRAELNDRVRSEIDEIRRNWLLAIEQEKASFLSEVQQRVGDSTIRILRRVLAEMADEDLQARVVNTFLRHLRSADANTRDRIARDFRDKTLFIESAFDMTRDDRAAVEAAIAELVGTTPEVKYTVAPEMLYGIRLSTGAHEIAWDFDEHIDNLHDQFAAIIDEQLDHPSLAGGPA